MVPPLASIRELALAFQVEAGDAYTRALLAALPGRARS
jgi:hypothetical protein